MVCRPLPNVIILLFNTSTCYSYAIPILLNNSTLAGWLLIDYTQHPEDEQVQTSVIEHALTVKPWKTKFTLN